MFGPPQLSKLEELWATLRLSFIPYGETEVMLLMLDEEVVEALDDGQVRSLNQPGRQPT